jgi:hypothetical protein
MTKAQQILELYGQALGTMPEQSLPKFIAAKVGTTHGYVRTVARQRKDRSRSAADDRYRETKNALFRTRYWADPGFREAKKARERQRYHSNRAEARA